MLKENDISKTALLQQCQEMNKRLDEVWRVIREIKKEPLDKYKLGRFRAAVPGECTLETQHINLGHHSGKIVVYGDKCLEIANKIIKVLNIN